MGGKSSSGEPFGESLKNADHFHSHTQSGRLGESDSDRRALFSSGFRFHGYLETAQRNSSKVANWGVNFRLLKKVAEIVLRVRLTGFTDLKIQYMGLHLGQHTNLQNRAFFSHLFRSAIERKACRERRSPANDSMQPEINA